MICKDKSTKSFPITAGLKQGDIFRTVFFNLYVNDIPSVLDNTKNDIGRENTRMLANNHLNALPLADDLVIFSLSKS